MKIAIIAGTSINHSTVFKDWELVQDTIYTNGDKIIPNYLRKEDKIVINRHGPLNSPPHKIDYHKNIRTIYNLGYRDVISLNSVGSLRGNIPPGSIVSCSDYVCLQQTPKTFFNGTMGGGKSGISNNLIPIIMNKLSESIEAIHATYVQMAGPRFETKAEVQIIKRWGDVVGMTAAHEADLCGELGINYNSLCIVDNYANGLINDNEVNFSNFKDLVKQNQEKVDRLLTDILEIFK